MSDLRQILTENLQNCRSLDFVVIAACKSYNVGLAFTEVAGVQHVVCIGKGYEVADEAAG